VWTPTTCRIDRASDPCTSFDQQVKVIAHQARSVGAHPPPLAHLGEQPQEPLPILRIDEDITARNPAIHHVMPQPRSLNA
jgi:hypothetical protein